MIVRGFCAFPGGAPKATLVDYAWLVDPHLVLVVRHPVAGLACDANWRVNLEVSESPQQGLACRQASVPR